MNATLRNILIFLGILLLLLCVWYFRSIVVYILVSGVFSIMGFALLSLDFGFLPLFYGVIGITGAAGLRDGLNMMVFILFVYALLLGLIEKRAVSPS